MKNTTIGVDPTLSYSSDGPVSTPASFSAIKHSTDGPMSLPSKECPNCNGTGEQIYKVPSPTNIAEDIEKKEKCDFCEGSGFIYDAGKAIVSSGPATPFLAQPQNVGVVCAVVNANVIPNLRVLLANVLGAIDASIPNKDQNRALRHIIRTEFDRAHQDILQRAYPTCSFGFEGYSLDPELSRSKAFSQATLALNKSVE
jgi:hypothetical protein